MKIMDAKVEVLDFYRNRLKMSLVEISVAFGVWKYFDELNFITKKKKSVVNTTDLDSWQCREKNLLHSQREREMCQWGERYIIRKSIKNCIFFSGSKAHID